MVRGISTPPETRKTLRPTRGLPRKGATSSAEIIEQKFNERKSGRRVQSCQGRCGGRPANESSPQWGTPAPGWLLAVKSA
jgi:hypothetical protein